MTAVLKSGGEIGPQIPQDHQINPPRGHRRQDHPQPPPQDVLRPLRVGELLDIMGEESTDEVARLTSFERNMEIPPKRYGWLLDGGFITLTFVYFFWAVLLERFPV